MGEAMARSWFYQLQNVDPMQVGKVKADVKVVDYSRDGTAEGRWSVADVQTMRGSDNWFMISNTPKDARRVLSYISIGEAESYRSYWKNEWLARGKKPLWLSDENPDWPANYKVEFWNGEWKEIVFNYLDDIIDAGFDGVYLDIIDAYEFFEERGVYDAGNRMIRFVRQIADHCQKRNPFFWIVPQNGEGLLVERSYRDAIDAIAKEDLWFGINGDGVHNGTSAIHAAKDKLDLMGMDAKPVLVVEYLDRAGDMKDAARWAQDAGYTLLITSRDLDKVA